MDLEGMSLLGGKESGSIAYDYFMDDNYGVATALGYLLWFLHTKYFSRLDSAR